MAAALGVGLSKSGLAGIGLFHVVVFAFLFGARESTGYVLPLLVAGDVCAVWALHQHVRWEYVRRMLLHQEDGVVAVRRLSYDLDALLFEERAQPCSKEVVVVDEQDAYVRGARFG